MGRLFQPFLFFLAGCTEHELRRQIEFLKAENEMLRKRVPKQRIFLSQPERERLVKLGTANGTSISSLIRTSIFTTHCGRIKVLVTVRFPGSGANVMTH